MSFLCIIFLWRCHKFDKFDKVCRIKCLNVESVDFVMYCAIMCRVNTIKEKQMIRNLFLTTTENFNKMVIECANLNEVQQYIKNME